MNIIMPQLGETVTEGTITKWYKKAGDTVKADETLFDIETDKVSTEIPSPVAGVIDEILIGEGVTAKVGVTLAVIRESGAAAAAKPVAVAAPVAVNSSARDASTQALRANAGERLSPVVRRLVAEHNLEISRISGTGRDRRITREDVMAFIANAGVPSNAAPTAPTAPTVVSAPAPAVAAALADRAGATLPLNAVRKRVAATMAKSWAAAPHVLQVVEADFYRVVQAHREHGDAWKAREGFVLTFMPFVTRAISIALGKYPRLNATFNGDSITLAKRINIGIAVDLNFDGLMVPVLKDVPNKSLPQIAREINDLATRARAGKLKPDDLTEGTYTISNNGSFGTVITAPIINLPQVAIMSTDAVRKKPVVIETADGDSIAVRPVGVLAQTFDHRALDGAYAAAFLREVKSIIETRHWVQDLQA
jgi:2-oxoglutarate dehydrogenase E2 component (dihydrolipoamide succinyltransferase)